MQDFAVLDADRALVRWWTTTPPAWVSSTPARGVEAVRGEGTVYSSLVSTA